MSTTQIPPNQPLPPSSSSRESVDFYDASHWETAYRDFDADDFPHLLVQLQDDLARSRRREAIWLSVILHLSIIILVLNGERLLGLLPHRTVAVVPLTNRDKELTYLELPPDAQKLSQPPKNSNIISDKNRIATSKAPHLDPKELKRILDSARAGTPGTNAPPPQPTQAPSPAQNAGAPQPQQSPPASPPQNSQNQMAKLQAPPVAEAPKINFNNSLSAGSAIEQAARAALQNKSGGTYGGGDGGDYGLGQGQRGQVQGNLEVLSDTMGVDFGPYLARVLHDVRQNWYNVIPESARPPLMKKGKLAIEFAILKDGKIAGQRVVATSGDVALDRAAWSGIAASNPFPPLPTQFGGQYLALRFYFFYNPDKNELQ